MTWLVCGRVEVPAREVSAPELELRRSSLLMHRWRGQRQMGSGASEGVSRWRRLSPTAGVNDGDEWRWGCCTAVEWGCHRVGSRAQRCRHLRTSERLDHYIGMTFWLLRVGNLTQLETTTKHVGQTQYLCHTTFKTFFSGGFRIALFWYIQDPSPLCTPGTLVTCRFLDLEAGSRWSSLPQLQLWYSNFQ